MKREEIRARLKNYEPIKRAETLPHCEADVVFIEGQGNDIRWAQATIQSLGKKRYISPIEQAAISAVRIMRDEDGHQIFDDDEAELFLDTFNLDLTFISEAAQKVTFSPNIKDLAKN